jgi:hypothetical protein
MTMVKGEKDRSACRRRPATSGAGAARSGSTATRQSADRGIKVLPMDYGYIRGAAPTVKRRFSEIFSM